MLHISLSTFSKETQDLKKMKRIMLRILAKTVTGSFNVFTIM